jgi:hypothetical protein
MSTDMFLRLLIGGLVALVGLVIAAWTHFDLALGDAVTLRHDTVGLVVFAGGLLFAYRTVKRHFDRVDAEQGG